MKPKTDLNNTQRKMLDEIYSDQFSQRAQAILGKRAAERKELVDDVLRQEGNDEFGALLDAGELFYSLFKDKEERLQEKGLYIDGKPTHLPKLALNWRGEQHERVTDFDSDTARIERQLSDRKREVRARIYGMNTTFDEVRAEIDAALADLGHVE